MLGADLTRRRWLASVGAMGGAALASGLSGGAGAQAADAPLEVIIANGEGAPPKILTALIRNQHYFDQNGLDATVNALASNQAILDALTGGKADVCMGSGVSNVIAAIAAGAPVRLLAPAFQKIVLAIFSAKPEVKTLKDLEGRKIGSGPKGQLVHQIITAAMLKEGADPTKAEFVNIGGSDAIFRAVVKGDVDAGIGDATVYADPAKYGVHLVAHGALWDELPDYTNQASYASLDTIKAKREALVRTLAAHGKAYRFIETPASHDAYLAAWATALGKPDPENAELQWRFFQRVKPYTTTLMLEEKSIRYIQDLNVKMGLQKAVLPYEAVVDNSLARDAVARIRA